MLWYCGMWVWRGLEPRGRPVRPAPVKERGLPSDSIISPTRLSTVLSFSVFNHARILTSGVYELCKSYTGKKRFGDERRGTHLFRGGGGCDSSLLPKTHYVY